MDNPLKTDLDHILEHTQGLWDELRGQRLFITGGTGFFGSWLMESLAWANDKLGLNARAVVLTRDPGAFARKAPHLVNHPAISIHIGDVRDFAFPEGQFSHAIHAATDVNARSDAEHRLLTFDTIVEGARRFMEFAAHAGAKKALLASSGAVYGRQPPDMPRMPEDYTGGPEPADPRSAYGEGKRAAETLSALYAGQHGVALKIARGFAFVGPYLPLDTHVAVGNFIRDGLRGGPILVNGDGAAYRSYLYAADLAVWLWTILLRGESSRPYNVGSEQEISIGALARAVAKACQPGAEVCIAQQVMPGVTPERYVPDTRHALSGLGLRTWIPLDEAIQRTIRWHRQSGSAAP